MLEIENFIKHNESWKELLQQPPYNLISNEDEDYILFKYNQIDIKDGGSDFDEPIVAEARGIIIDKHKLIARALSFPKFWNIQEEKHAKIDWKHARVQEKVDGSKVLVWYNEYKQKWQLSTSGTLDAYNAVVNGEDYTYGDLFEEAVKNSDLLEMDNLFNKLDIGHCYTFELVSPKARIVVPYNKTEIYFIGLRDIYNFQEEKPAEEYLSEFIKTPKEYTLHTLEDCFKATEKMGFDEEGFVVVDDNWNRVKIKSPQYVLAHFNRMNNGTSYGRILEMIEQGSDKDFLKIYPEYTEKFDKVREAKEKFVMRLDDALFKTARAYGEWHLDRKKIAEYINTNFKDIGGFLFKYLDISIQLYYINGEWSKLSKNKKLKYLGFKEEKDIDEFKEE